MRYVCMHKVNEENEAGTRPPRELVEGMGRLIGETAQAGRFLAGEGLLPSSRRYRLTFSGPSAASCTVTPGPFPGRNEVPAGLVILEVGAVEEALDWAKRFGAAIGAEELELGPLTEAWHLGICPEPTGPVPLRFMILHKEAKAGHARTPAQQSALAALTAEMVQAGVLVFRQELQPSANAVRLNYRDNVRAVTDGPFTESKELIGGFCMVQMRSLDEVLVWCDRFARILGGTVEVDVRPVAEQDDAPGGER